MLVSSEYISAKTKLNVRCGAEHEFDITADNLKHGRWCPECKRRNQSVRQAINFWTVGELRAFARDHHDGDCLATEASPMLAKVLWKCGNQQHRPFTAVIAKVIHSGQWCPSCWQERRKPPKPPVAFETVVQAVRDRGGEIINVGKVGVWKGSKTRLTIRCANGDEWSAEASNLLYAGSWCPECLNKGERIVRAIFEETFGGEFPKAKPEWLLSTIGRKLELDGYNEERQDYVIKHDAIKRADDLAHRRAENAQRVHAENDEPNLVRRTQLAQM